MQSSAKEELNQLENQIKKLKKKLRQLQQLNERTSSSIPVFCKKNKDSIIKSIYNNNSTDLSFWKEFIQKKIDTDEICIVKTPMVSRLNMYLHSLPRAGIAQRQRARVA